MIALCIGHSRPGDKGAVSAGGVTEHAFNSILAKEVQSLLEAQSHRSVIIDRYQGNNYGSAQVWLASKLKQIESTVAVELHFNAADSKAKGFEYLHWATSPRGKRLATFFHDAHKQDFPAAVSRGVKALDKTSRGALFCKIPHCPSIILEPFFGDNPDEWEIYSAHPARLAQVYARALHAYLQAS